MAHTPTSTDTRIPVCGVAALREAIGPGFGFVAPSARTIELTVDRRCRAIDG